MSWAHFRIHFPYFGGKKSFLKYLARPLSWSGCWTELRNGLTSSAGARVTLHQPEVRPLVLESGLNLEPNKATQIAIEKVPNIAIKYLD